MLRLLSALCFCASVNAGTKQNAQKPPPGRDELLQLNKGNFNAELKKHKQLLVHFCELHANTRTVSVSAWSHPSASCPCLFIPMQTLPSPEKATGYRRCLKVLLKGFRGQRSKRRCLMCQRRRTWLRSSMPPDSPQSSCTYQEINTTPKCVLVRANHIYNLVTSVKRGISSKRMKPSRPVVMNVIYLKRANQERISIPTALQG